MVVTLWRLGHSASQVYSNAEGGIEPWELAGCFFSNRSQIMCTASLGRHSFTLHSCSWIGCVSVLHVERYSDLIRGDRSLEEQIVS